MESGRKIFLSDRILRWLAWALVGVYFVLAGAGGFLLLLASPAGIVGIPIAIWILLLFLVGIWPVIGALIIARHPRHPVGWLLFASFPPVAIAIFIIGYFSYASTLAPGTLQVPTAVLLFTTYLQFITLVSFTLMNLLFPTGKLPSPRWQIVAWIAVATLPVLLVLQVLKPGFIDPGLYPDLINPYAVGEPVWAVLEPVYIITIAILILCLLASVFSLFLRLRRARGDERQQVKWLILPAFVFWLGQPVSYFEFYDPSGFLYLLGVILVLISAPLIVIAVAFAIFKYRLYDIDIIIRRTLVYSALTGTLALVYFSSVVLLQQVFPSESPIVIVLSTLAIAALFSPLRRRIQDAIDRRFYRRKYDAEVVVAVFSAGLREEVDLEQLGDRLLAAVEQTLQPESLSLWLKEK